MPKHSGIYCRVSSKQQDLASQLPDLERWAVAHGSPVQWYKDKFTGKTMDRPGMENLMADLRAGKIERIVVWRLDRLGRTTRGLSAAESIWRISGDTIPAVEVAKELLNDTEDNIRSEAVDLLGKVGLW